MKRKPAAPQMKGTSGEEFGTKSTPAPPEPPVQQHLARQMPSGSSMPTTTHHPDDGAAFNANFHAVNNSQPHDNVASERIMSQSNSDTDPESTDEREEEHEIKHFSLHKRVDCLDNFMTYNIAGFKQRPSYEEILAEQDDSSEQLEITAMMIQSATKQSSNTIEEGTSSSAVESPPIHGRGSLVQQVARRVESYMRFSGVSDAIMPRIMDTIPPSLWFRAIRATVAHITSSEPPNHVLDFMKEDISPATTDPNDHNALTNYGRKEYSQKKS
jgi:hypothetical protein